VNDVKKMDKKGLAQVTPPPLTDKGGSEKGGVSELSRRTGLSRTAISEYLRLLNLQPDLQVLIQRARTTCLQVTNRSFGQSVGCWVEREFDFAP
jgi:transcriptional regulator with XRE-family HTH domain